MGALSCAGGNLPRGWASWGVDGEEVCTLWVGTLAPSARICSNMCMPLPAELPPYLASDQTSWPLPGQQHVGALRGPDGWKVVHWGPGFWNPFDVYGEQEHAKDVAHALWRAWDTVHNMSPSQARSLLEFFQPRPAA